MIKWEKTDTGINRELVDNYHPSQDLPGTTIIPSHRGKHGAQLGKEKRTPIPMIVDPDRADGGIVVLPHMLDDQEEVASASASGDASAAYASLSKGNGMARKVAGTPAPVQKTGGKTRTPAPAKKAAVRKVRDFVPPQAAADTAPEYREPVVDSVPEDTNFVERIPQSMDADAIVAAVLSQLMPKLADMISAVADVKPDAVLDAMIEPESEPVADGVAAARPGIRLEMQKGTSGQLSLNVHHVIDKDDGLLVLVYDLAYQGGDRLYPPVDLEMPYRVTIKKGPDVQTSMRAIYTGEVFEHAGKEYQILHKYVDTPDAATDRQDD